MDLTCWQDAGPGDRAAGVRATFAWMLPAQSQARAFEGHVGSGETSGQPGE
jgi:hypothetical protein